MCHKAAETAHNINNTFGLGTANKHTAQRWFKFCKGDKSLEDEEQNNQLRGSSKLIFSKLHEKLPKKSMSTILGLFGI